MGEIRSTIDIMMERTRGMTLSSREREEFRRDEFVKRAKGIRLKLLEEAERFDDVLSALDSEPPDDRDFLQEVLWQIMIEMLPTTGEELLRSLAVMEKLPQGQSKGRILREIHSCFKNAVKRQAEDRKRVVAKEKKKLAALGISGSAVVPKIPSQQGWDDEFRTDLAKLKNALLSAAS